MLLDVPMSSVSPLPHHRAVSVAGPSAVAAAGLVVVPYLFVLGRDEMREGRRSRSEQSAPPGTSPAARYVAEPPVYPRSMWEDAGLTSGLPVSGCG